MKELLQQILMWIITVKQQEHKLKSFVSTQFTERFQTGMLHNLMDDDYKIVSTNSWLPIHYQWTPANFDTVDWIPW